MWVYVNYPNPHFTMHRDPSCQMIQIHGKPGQRVRRVNMHSLGDFLSDLIGERMQFASQSGFNDVWLEIKLHTPEQEIGLAYVAQAIIGRRYTPLATARITTHC